MSPNVVFVERTYEPYPAVELRCRHHISRCDNSETTYAHVRSQGFHTHMVLVYELFNILKQFVGDGDLGVGNAELLCALIRHGQQAANASGHRVLGHGWLCELSQFL